jgi:REP element-mobilizing transposase RayT
MSYDPAKHHRRSIRLKGHDYAGGGVYFVTICAHRRAGDIFAPPDVREMVAREWENAAGAGHVPAPYVIMPDHFHALVRTPEPAPGPVPAQGTHEARPHGAALGDVIGAFKSRVVHEYISGVKAGRWPRFPGKIWHRNYYETIVRSAEAEQRIAEYIRMNPWRCVQNFGGGLRGIGNPTLWGGEKLGVLCSRNAPRIGRLPAADVYLGGWHSPKEKEILDWLLKKRRRLIACPAWGVEDYAFAPGVRDALEDNRMLILEMRDTSGNLAAAEARNRFVIKNADALFTPHVTPGGMLDRLLKEVM